MSRRWGRWSPGNILRVVGQGTHLLGAALVVVGSALTWAKFRLFGVEINLPGIVGWGAVTATVGALALLRTRRWPILGLMLGGIALGFALQGQRDTGRVVTKGLISLQLSLSSINDRLSRITVPPIDPFGAPGQWSDHVGPGPTWTVWGGALMVAGATTSLFGSVLRRSCPRCHARWSSARADTGVAFCPHCGSGVGPLVQCPRCQTPLEPSDRFCVGCGVSVDGGLPSLVLDSPPRPFGEPPARRGPT